MKCPTCGSETFYVKDPDDEYETHAIELKDGQVAFCESPDPRGLEIQPETETFCDKCTWHGKLRQLKGD